MAVAAQAQDRLTPAESWPRPPSPATTAPTDCARHQPADDDSECTEAIIDFPHGSSDTDRVHFDIESNDAAAVVIKAPIPDATTHYMLIAR